jgi:hypothetical protein
VTLSTSYLNPHRRRFLGHAGSRTVTLCLKRDGAPPFDFALTQFWVSNGDTCHSLCLMLSPTRMAGNALFFTEAHQQPDTSIELYLRGSRSRVVPTFLAFGEGFLGVDFAYDDFRFWLPVQNLESHAHEHGSKTYTVEGTLPRRDQAKEQNGGGARVRADICSQTHVPLTTEFIDHDGETVRTCTATDLISRQGVWTPMRMEAIRPRLNTRTEMHLNDFMPGLRIQPADLSPVAVISRLERTDASTFASALVRA